MAAVLAMSGLAVASPARADEGLTARVPFDFIVGQSRLPAGDYVVSQTSSPGVVAIRSADNRRHILVLTNGDSGKAPARPELVFKQFEGDNFLFRITDGYAIEREIPLTPGRMEKERLVAASSVTVPLATQ